MANWRACGSLGLAAGCGHATARDVGGYRTFRLCAAASGAPHGASGLAALTFTRLVGQSESVWVAEADGSHAREVTDNGYSSTLSPDGRWLTFERDHPGSDFVPLFLHNLVTGKLRALGYSLGNGRWAPTGARLAVAQPAGFFLIDATSGSGRCSSRLASTRSTSRPTI